MTLIYASDTRDASMSGEIPEDPIQDNTETIEDMMDDSIPETDGDETPENNPEDQIDTMETSEEDTVSLEAQSQEIAEATNSWVMTDEELDAMISEFNQSNEQVSETITEWSPEWDISLQLKEKDAAVKQLTTTLQNVIKDNAKMKVQLAEKEMYAPSENQEVTIISWNVDKALEGDEISKQKVLDMLSSLREKLVGSTFESMEMEMSNDIASDINSVGSATAPVNPSIPDQGGWSGPVVWG